MLCKYNTCTPCTYVFMLTPANPQNSNSLFQLLICCNNCIIIIFLPTFEIKIKLKRVWLRVAKIFEEIESFAFKFNLPCVNIKMQSWWCQKWEELI